MSSTTSATMSHNPQNGPDQILEADSYTCTDVNGAVKMRTDVTVKGGENVKPVSIPTKLREAARQGGDCPALSVKRDGEWLQWTYSQYLHTVETVAKAFIQLGLGERRSVAIVGFNSPEWFFADLGAIFCGAMSVGIYPTNSADATRYVIEHSGADIVMVEGQKELDKIMPYRDQLTGVKAIVQYWGEPTVEGVMSWDELIKIGRENGRQEDLEERLRRMAINQCCHLVYTSGTTGHPKGVMLSHDNLLYAAQMVVRAFELLPKVETYVSYLPLSHIAANVTDIYVMLTCFAHVHFAEKDALKGSLINTVKEVRPTRFIGVPRVWEKIAESMQEVGRNNKGIKKLIGDWAKGVGLDHNKRMLEGRGTGSSFNYMLAQKLVFSKIREALGLDKSVGFWAAAAPVTVDTHEYFLSLDMRILEIYGMSECSGPQMTNTNACQRVGSIGKSFPGFETRLDTTAAKATTIKAKLNEEDAGKVGVMGDPGEICIRGRHVMMGYYADEEKTAHAIDKEGWLHSGDVAAQDQDGFYILTGRIKELLVTAGGENVAPVPIEDAIMKELPCVSQAMVVGDRRKFLSCVLAFKTMLDPVTEMPTDLLTPTSLDWCRRVAGREIDTVQEILKGDDKILKAIESALKRVNEQAVSNAQKVQKYVLAESDFSVAGGELGPTLKLKRNVVLEKYQEEIEALYADV